jgi:hypothetical protein
MNYEAQIRADIIEDALSQAFTLMTEAHAIMRRCHWHEPTGLEGDEPSALECERKFREFLGVDE